MNRFIVYIKQGGMEHEACRFSTAEAAETYRRKVLPEGTKSRVYDTIKQIPSNQTQLFKS